MPSEFDRDVRLRRAETGLVGIDRYEIVVLRRTRERSDAKNAVLTRDIRDLTAILPRPSAKFLPASTLAKIGACIALVADAALSAEPGGLQTNP